VGFTAAARARPTRVPAASRPASSFCSAWWTSSTTRPAGAKRCG